MKTEEICMLKKSIKWAAISLLIASLFWFLFSLQAAYAYTPNGSPADLKSGSRINAGSGSSSLFLQPGTGTSGGSDTANFRIVFGTQSTTGNGSTGFILPGTTTGLPFIDYLFSSGSSTFNFSGFGAIAVDGETIPSVGTVSNKLDSVGGVGTNNTFNNPTFSGAGTITASFGANGLVISPEEYSMLDGATVPLNTATGSITNHAHTGSDGTTQVSHANLTDRGTQTHTQIDTFIASKASASGVASLDANSLVVQNPASGTSTPGISSIPISLGTGLLDDSWLSSVVSKLGQTIELGTETTGNTDNITEGNTNKYYTDARVNAAVGSLSVNQHNDVNIIFNDGDFVKIQNGQLVSGSSSVSVSFGGITGSATASQIPLISGILGSVTSVQLPLVTKLYGTTTQQAAETFGQLYMQNSVVTDENVKLLLHMDNPGTSTFVDSSVSPHTITAVNQVIGTTTAKFGSGGGYFDGDADQLTIPDSADWFLGTDDFTIDFQVIFKATTTQILYGQLIDTSNIGSLVMYDAGQLWFRSVNAGSWKADYRYTWTPTLNQPYHIEIGRSGTTLYLFINGDLKTWTTIATAISTNSLPDIASALYIGCTTVTGYMSGLNAILDEFRWSIGIVRHTSSFVAPTVSYEPNYSQYSTKYTDPVNGKTVFEIQTHGTAIIGNYIYCNATTTVFGLGTNTAITATTTAYSGWFDGAVRATAFNVASTEKIKENIKPIKIRPDMLDAEGIAKMNYIANNKIAWIAANSGSYTTVVNQTGTGSVIQVDTPDANSAVEGRHDGTGSVIQVDTATMESDYNNYIEAQWASDLNQGSYTTNVQKTYEKDFWQMFDGVTPKSWNPKDKLSLTRKGFVVEDMPGVVKGDDGQSIDPMALVAYMSLVQQALKADTIFALSTLKELIMTGTVTQQKIDYCNDRLEVLSP